MLDIPSVISRTCFLITVLFNSTLIYLTLYQTKEIVGTYRNMIITFASIGICFSTLDILVRPMFHSFNGCVFYFTLGNTFRSSKILSELSLLVYTGVYGVVMAFLTVQFMYRAVILARPTLAKHFDGYKLVIWIFYSILVGAFWTTAAYCVYPDQNVYDYLRTEILDAYGVEIKTVPGFAILAYNNDGQIRWNSVASISLVTIIISSQYSIMLFSGVTMYQNIKESMNTSSSYYARLQKQFFMTLVYQVSAPSLLFHAPAFIVLFAPFFDFKFSFHSGIIVYGFSAYPLVDSLIVLGVITEYKNAILDFFHTNLLKVQEFIKAEKPKISMISISATP